MTWDAFRRSPCWPDDCFCEALRDALIVQPANAWSNLAFLAAGVWIARQPGGRVLGAATCVIGATSFLFHASLTYVGMWLDLMGMYLFITFLYMSGLRLGERFLPAYLGLNAALGAVIWFLPGSRRWLFAALVLLVARAELLEGTGERRWLAGALACLAAGFALWSIDYWKVACSPQSLLQGHAAWHALCAVSAALAYRYLDTTGRLLDA